MYGQGKEKDVLRVETDPTPFLANFCLREFAMSSGPRSVPQGAKKPFFLNLKSHLTSGFCHSGLEETANLILS